MSTSKKMSKNKMIFKFISGVILLVLGVISTYYGWQYLLSLVKGVIGIVLIICGLICLVTTKS